MRDARQAQRLHRAQRRAESTDHADAPQNSAARNPNFTRNPNSTRNHGDPRLAPDLGLAGTSTLTAGFPGGGRSGHALPTAAFVAHQPSRRQQLRTVDAGSIRVERGRNFLVDVAFNRCLRCSATEKTALRHNSDVLGWDAIATSDAISAWRDGPDHGAARFWLVESTAQIDRSRCALRVPPRDVRPIDLNMSLKCNICIQIGAVRTCSIVRYPS